MIDRHTETATEIDREAAFRPDEIADDNDWAGVGIGPVGRTRDSNALDRSNFDVITDDLQARYPSETEILRFGHWACGWIEEIAYNAGNADLRAAVKAWRDKLDNYPIADEEHYCELEHGELMEYATTEISKFEIPDGLTVDRIVDHLLEAGDVTRIDDCSDHHIEAAIEDAHQAMLIDAATPPASQLQLVTDHGRPHVTTEDAIENAIAAGDPE